jgi:hypothetical protein
MGADSQSYTPERRPIGSSRRSIELLAELHDPTLQTYGFFSMFSFSFLSVTGRVFSSDLPNPACVWPHHGLARLATECLFEFRHVGDNTIDSVLRR